MTEIIDEDEGLASQAKEELKFFPTMCELESYDEIFTKIENGRITSNNNNYPEIITVENGRITEEVKQQIIQLDTQGVLPDQISLLLNLTKSCVHQFLKEYHQ